MRGRAKLAPAFTFREPLNHDPGHPQARARLTARGLALGEAELRCRCPPSELDFYAILFAWLGDEAHLHSPEQLRAKLGQLGEGLVRRYGKRGGRAKHGRTAIAS